VLAPSCRVYRPVTAFAKLRSVNRAWC
jgi:hypothetical protein